MASPVASDRPISRASLVVSGPTDPADEVARQERPADGPGPQATEPRSVVASVDALVQDGLVKELTAAREQIAQLKAALDSSREIGAATGILMERHHLTREQAFDRLRATSQRSHRKLRDIAGELLATGGLPQSNRHDSRQTPVPHRPPRPCPSGGAQP